MVRFERNREIVLGYVPTRRDIYPPKEFAISIKDDIYQRFLQILQDCGDVRLVTIDDVVEDGLLWNVGDVDAVVEKLVSKKVDGIVFPHCNFGQEEAVAKVAKALDKPVLVWGPRDPDPVPDYEAGRSRRFDTQCGLFATTKALLSYDVKFTYIENCWLDSPILEQGVKDFVRVVSVVKAFRGMRVAQIGTRPRAFLSTRINESELLAKFGIEIVTIWAEEVKHMVECVEKGLPPVYGKPMLSWTMDKLPAACQGTPDPRVEEIVRDIEAKVDTSDAGHEKIVKIACIELAIMELCRVNKCDAVAIDCTSFMYHEFGVDACFIMGELFDRGLPAACEMDLHAAISALIGEAAARYATPAFVADVTIRHPHDDNAELLWHCGPFAKSLAKEDVVPEIHGNKGRFEIKHGPVTVIRFDQDKGNYVLFADEAEGIDGPKTDGNYIWIRVKDWPKWERKLMYGPYIHHVAGIHGHWAKVIKEACKYISPVRHDSVEEIADM